MSCPLLFVRKQSRHHQDQRKQPWQQGRRRRRQSRWFVLPYYLLFLTIASKTTSGEDHHDLHRRTPNTLPKIPSLSSSSSSSYNRSAPRSSSKNNDRNHDDKNTNTNDIHDNHQNTGPQPSSSLLLFRPWLQSYRSQRREAIAAIRRLRKEEDGLEKREERNAKAEKLVVQGESISANEKQQQQQLAHMVDHAQAAAAAAAAGAVARASSNTTITSIITTTTITTTTNPPSVTTATIPITKNTDFSDIKRQSLMNLLSSRLVAAPAAGGTSNTAQHLSTPPRSSQDDVSPWLRSLMDWGQAGVGLVAVFGTTLRLWESVIAAARRGMSTVGGGGEGVVTEYDSYDKHHGRYLPRKTYAIRRQQHTRMIPPQWMEDYDIPAAFRAFARMGLQFGTMTVANSIFSRVYDGHQDHIMIIARRYCCFFLPAVAYRYCLGSIWVVSVVLLASRSMEFWITIFPFLRLKTTSSISDHTFSASPFFIIRTTSRNILQRIKDPETSWPPNWTHQLQQYLTTTRYHNGTPSSNSGNNAKLTIQSRRRRRLGGRGTTPAPVRLNTLDFPSTFPPLYVLSGMALVHVIAQTLLFLLPMKMGEDYPTSSTSTSTISLMQDFCGAVTILEEWKRIFLRERRITLGILWSAGSFVAFFVLACSAAATTTAVGSSWWIAALLILPMASACLVSGYKTTVLFGERY